MRVHEAIERRVSTRAFKSAPVPSARVRILIERARRAPSGGNLQPWNVHALAGSALDELKASAAANPFGEAPEYEVYPQALWDPYRSRRFECGEDLYATIPIPRHDKAARLGQLARNGTLFGAPVGLFVCIDRNLGPPQWSDLGMFIQSFMLLATEDGLATCAQEYWSRYPVTLARLLALPQHQMVFCGIALGHPEPDAPINRLRTRRAPFDEWATMRGFDDDQPRHSDPG